MREKWTGDLIGRMHNERVTYDDLAEVLGCTKSYISMVLNGHRSPENARERMNDAFSAVLERRKMEEGHHAKDETEL